MMRQYRDGSLHIIAMQLAQQQRVLEERRSVGAGRMENRGRKRRSTTAKKEEISLLFSEKKTITKKKRRRQNDVVKVAGEKTWSIRWREKNASRERLKLAGS